MIDYVKPEDKNYPKTKQAILQAVGMGYTVDKDGKVFKPNGAPQSLNLSQNGYLKFSVSLPSFGKSRLSSCTSHPCIVHQLVGYLKFGKFWDDGDPLNIIDHIDQNKTNNSFDNIRRSNKSLNALNTPLEDRVHRSKIASAASLATRTDIKLTEEKKRKIDYLLSKNSKISTMEIARQIFPDEQVTQNSAARSRVRNYLQSKK